MKTFRLIGQLLCALWLFSGPIARADIASGGYTNLFPGDFYLWDVSGTYHESVDGITLDYTIVMDPSGKFTGNGTFYYDAGGSDYLTGDFTVSGSIKTSGSAARVSLTMLIGGTGEVEGYDVLFTGKATEKLEIDTITREMIGTLSGSVKVTIPSLGRKAGGSIPRTETSTMLPVEVDGQWKLILNVIPNVTKYTGTGTVELSNGKSFDLGLTGSYTSKKDTSKLSLKGLDLLKSMKLSLVASTTNLQMNVQSLKGSALGQKLKLDD